MRLLSSEMCFMGLLIICLSIDSTVSDILLDLEQLAGLSDKFPKVSVASPYAVDISGADIESTQRVQYVMNLNSNSPAVLDSAVTFTAELKPIIVNHSNTEAQSTRFIYRWMNMANRMVSTTSGGLTSNISITFSSSDVRVGDYVMTVAAYNRDDPATIVASAARKFTLTKDLNGLLILNQKLDYQRNPNTFSTKKDLMLVAYVHDQFLQRDPNYDFYWYKQTRLLKHTKLPNYTIQIYDQSSFTLSSMAIIRSSDGVQNLPNLCTQQNQRNCMEPANYSSQTGSLNENDGQVNNTSISRIKRLITKRSSQRDTFFVKNGTFQQTVVMKDPVESCRVLRIDVEDRGISMKDVAVFNITCVGSTPSGACVNVTNLNGSLPINDFCVPSVFVNKLSHVIRVRLVATGWNDVHFFVYNDVSRYHLIESFFGYQPDSVNVPALTIPIVFAVLGIIIITVGAAYIIRLRKSPLVEVADFDFHPTLTSGQPATGSRFSGVAVIIKSMFFRDRHETNNTRSPRRKKSSQSTENEFAKNLYESL